MKRYHLYIIIGLLLSIEYSYTQTIYLSLDDCREMAAEYSVAVRNAALDVQAAKAQRQEALAEYFPSVSANAFGFHALNPMIEIGIKDIFGTSDFTNNLQYIIDHIAPQLGFDPIYRSMQYGGMASVSLMQPIFAGGRIVNGNRLASLGVEAASLQQQIALRTNAEQIEQQYWQVVALEEKLQTINELDALLDTVSRDVQTAVQAGLANPSDHTEVLLRQAELQSGKIQLTNGIRLAKMNLFNGIGQPYSYVRLSGDTIPYIDDILLSDRLDSLSAPDAYYVNEHDIAINQEETKLLELQVEAKQLEKKMVVGETLPQIAIGASYGYTNYLNKGNTNGAIYAVVQIPITDWGKNARKIQRYDYQVEKARNEQVYLSEQILLQVRQLWLNLTTAWEQLQVSEKTIALSQDHLAEMHAHYQAGMAALTDLLQAQTQLRTAREEQINRAIQYRLALQAYLLRIQ